MQQSDPELLKNSISIKNWKNLIATSPNKLNKLTNFIDNHQLMKSKQKQFMKDKHSVEQIYKIMKNRLNLLNPHHVQNSDVRKDRNNQDQLLYQSEQMYFRQLNRMCQGQQSFQNQKKEEKSKAKSLIAQKNINMKINSVCGQRKSRIFKKYNSKDHNLIQDEENQKFSILPNFADLVKGYTVGYANLTSNNSLKKKMKTFKQDSIKPRFGSTFNINKMNFQNMVKNQKLKNEIKGLKKKARQKYELNFENFQYQHQDQKRFNQDNMADKTFENIEKVLVAKNLQSRKVIHCKMPIKQNEQFNQYQGKCYSQLNNAIPANIMSKKLRPCSVGVGFSIVRPKTTIKTFHKNNYFRV